MLSGIFDTLENKGLICIYPLPDCMSRLGLVFHDIVEENISVSVENRGLVSVENVQFPKRLFGLGNVTCGGSRPWRALLRSSQRESQWVKIWERIWRDHHVPSRPLTGLRPE
jgi:hypothetical protein